MLNSVYLAFGRWGRPPRRRLDAAGGAGVPLDGERIAAEPNDEARPLGGLRRDEGGQGGEREARQPKRSMRQSRSRVGWMCVARSTTARAGRFRYRTVNGTENCVRSQRSRRTPP